MIHDLPKNLITASKAVLIKKLIQENEEYEQIYNDTLNKYGVTTSEELDNDKRDEFFDDVNSELGKMKKKQDVAESENCDDEDEKEFTEE